MKILLVDDSRTVRLLTTQILHDIGYHDIVAAEEYESAVALMHKAIPGLILSDMNMPGKSGLDLLKYVRSTPELTHIPFVIISTFQDRSTIVEAIKAGAQNVLLKPIEKIVLYEKLVALSNSHGIDPPPRKIDTASSAPLISAQSPDGVV